MAKFEAHTYVNGTAALKPKSQRKQATIIRFPSRQHATVSAPSTISVEANRSHTRSAARLERSRKTHAAAHPVMSFLSSVAARSEMFCSLAFETCAGCMYNLFSHAQVCKFGIVLVGILALGIFFGA